MGMLFFMFNFSLVTAASTYPLLSCSSTTCEKEVEDLAGFSIALENNPSTGYQWSLAYDTAFLKLDSSNSVSLCPSTSTSGGITQMTVGCGQTTTYNFSALKVGKVQITATYKSPSGVTSQTKYYNITINLSPVNGVCGSSNESSFSSIPTTNLCSYGTASSLSGSGPWSWSCAGLNGGTTASCSAKLISISCVKENQSIPVTPVGLTQSCCSGLTLCPASTGVNGSRGTCKSSCNVVTPNTCTDSDGGKNYYVKGTIESCGTKSVDFCVSPTLGADSRVIKYYCSGFSCDSSKGEYGVASVEYSCPNGCNDGKCYYQKISNISGNKTSYVTGEKIDLKIEGATIDGVAAKDDGWNVQYYTYNTNDSNNYLKEYISSNNYNGVYSNKYWNASFTAPQAPGNYFTEINLYCSQENSKCWNLLGKDYNLEYKQKIYYSVSDNNALVFPTPDKPLNQMTREELLKFLLKIIQVLLNEKI